MKLLQIFILMLVLTLAGCLDDRHELQIQGVANYKVEDDKCSYSTDDFDYRDAGIVDLAQYITNYKNFNYDYLLNLAITNNNIISKDNQDNDEIKLKKGITITGADVVIKYSFNNRIKFLHTVVSQESFFLGSRYALYTLSIKDIFRKIILETLDDATASEGIDYESSTIPGTLDRSKLMNLVILLDKEGQPTGQTDYWGLNDDGERVVQQMWEILAIHDKQEGKLPGHYLDVTVKLLGKRVIDNSEVESNPFNYRLELETTALFNSHRGDAIDTSKPFMCGPTCGSYQDYPKTCEQK